MDNLLNDSLSAQLTFEIWRRTNSREKIESFCRQIISFCNREFILEREKLLVEQKEILDRRKREQDYDRVIDEAPGVFLNETIHHCICVDGCRVIVPAAGQLCFTCQGPHIHP